MRAAAITGLKKILPVPVKPYLRDRYEAMALRRVPQATCQTENLRQIPVDELDRILAAAPMEAEWADTLTSIDDFEISQTLGGVNIGDRRAIHHLVRGFRPQNVLEIGTHIGASTTHIAQALKLNQHETGDRANLTTVDIIDVNSPVSGSYASLGLRNSPAEMIGALGCADLVEFRVSPAQTFLRSTKDSFDLIFLDGDHSAAAVYQEIPLALERLNKSGVILLHDYFPNGGPIWDGSPAITGPYRGAARHQAEGAGFKVIPLGELQWPTKLGSNKTSLAIVAGN